MNYMNLGEYLPILGFHSLIDKMKMLIESTSKSLWVYFFNKNNTCEVLGMVCNI